MTGSESDRTPGEMLLEANGLGKTFVLGGRRLEVLKNATLAVRPSEVVAVVGISGVGKSTLLHILGGLERPDGGTLRYRGQNVFDLGERERARFRNKSIGFVFQFHHLLPEFTALENVMLPARILGKSPSEARAAARDLLARVGLAERTEHRPAQLSGGEQQRVAVARSLVNRPDLLLADEPSGNLDPATGAEIYDLLFDLRDALGQSIIVVTHSGDLVARADRVLELHAGSLEPAKRVESSGEEEHR